MFDLFIKNGNILNGTGGPAFHGNIGIKDGKILYVGRNDYPAGNVIDAAGLTVTPGFIDSHSHSDSALLWCPDMKEKIEQGITTSIGGNCGNSVVPCCPDPDPDAGKKPIGDTGLTADIFRSVPAFLSGVEKLPLGSNNAMLLGHSSVRRVVMGMENRHATPAELEKMKEIVSEGLDAGAAGVSFGLFYTPGNYAGEEELVELASLCGKKGKVIAAHLRNEADGLIGSVEEFLRIAEKSGARAVFSHHKAFGGKENWGKVSHSLRLIDKACERGLDAYLDVYPYTASYTNLASRLIPQKYHAMGLANVLKDRKMRDEIRDEDLKAFGEDLSFILVTRSSAFPQYEGKRADEIAALHGKDVYNSLFDIVENDGYGTMACYFTMCEEDVKTVLAHPRAMVCTDSGVAGSGTSYHPRLRGSFPRVLGRYVREEKIVPLREMIRKMTSMPASVYSLPSKGLIWEGMDADLCLFDAGKIIDRADYACCTLGNEGLNYVILNGSVVVTDGVYGNSRQGKLLLQKKD